MQEIDLFKKTKINQNRMEKIMSNTTIPDRESMLQKLLQQQKIHDDLNSENQLLI